MSEIGDFSPQWRAEMALRIEEATRPRLNEADKLTGPLPGRPRIRIELETGAIYAACPRLAGDRRIPIGWWHFDLKIRHGTPRGGNIRKP